MVGATQFAQQTPKTYTKIGHGARVAALNDTQTNLNAWLTHWSSVTPAVKVLATNAGDDNLHLTGAINNTINTMNAAAAEFSLVAGNRMKNFITVDYGSFVLALNMINTQLQAMATAKP